MRGGVFASFNLHFSYYGQKQAFLIFKKHLHFFFYELFRSLPTFLLDCCLFFFIFRTSSFFFLARKLNLGETQQQESVERTGIGDTLNPGSIIINCLPWGKLYNLTKPISLYLYSFCRIIVKLRIT